MAKYNPDFFMEKTKENHTLKRTGNITWGTISFREPYLEIFRDYFDEIPITQIDEEFGMSYGCLANLGEPFLSLGKQDLYNKIKEALNKYAIKQNKKINTTYEDTTYVVPVIKYIQKNIPKAKQKENEIAKPIERTIIVNGNSYSISKKYKRIGGENFIPLKIPEDIDEKLNIKLEEYESYCNISKFNNNKNTIKITLSQEYELSSLHIKPEPLIFEKIHDTTMNCDTKYKKCDKYKHCINCLKNNPGFITSFELAIRSSLTNDLWVSIGTFNGNNNLYESTKISLGKILVKEIRITNIKFINSIDKIDIIPIQYTLEKNIIKDEYVTYKLIEPKNGKYIKGFDKVLEKDSLFYNDCYYDQPKGNANKKKSRFMKNAMEI